MEGQPFLIVGLGNPGREYRWTRHNFGMLVLEALAEKEQLSYKKSLLLQSKKASGTISGVAVTLLLPLTYVNRSGAAVRAAMRRVGVPLQHLLVVVDDLYLSFGEMRLRAKGSSGGHNGLKSIEESLGTQDYARLRLGIGQPVGESMADYVLQEFSAEEKRELPLLLSAGVEAVKVWLSEER